jgi:Methyltransferase domain
MCGVKVTPVGEEVHEADDRRLADLVGQIPAEECSRPGCGRPAAAVLERGGTYRFLCAPDAERAARQGFSVHEPAEGGGVEPVKADGGRQRWEANWARPDFVPKFRAESIPAVIRRAVEEKWFPAGAALVDLGCGSGEIAAWLAGHAYDVVGVDFAEAAIERAKEANGHLSGLSFAVVDVAREALPGGPFDALLDRGCFQGDSSTKFGWRISSVTATSSSNAAGLRSSCRRCSQAAAATAAIAPAEAPPTFRSRYASATSRMAAG